MGATTAGHADRIRFVHVRHEESAAFAACAYAKYAGRLGVCLATSGPGAIHLLNGHGPCGTKGSLAPLEFGTFGTKGPECGHGR